MRTGIFLQSRMGSSRLPGKVLKNLCGKSIMDWIHDSIIPVLNSDTFFCVLTSEQKENMKIINWCGLRKVSFFAGSEEDVLDRYYRAAIKYDVKHIMRLTADNPLVDPEEITHLLNLHLDTDADYSHSQNYLGCKLPDGLGAEIFSLDALEKSWNKGTEANHREHVNEYIHENMELFNTRCLEVPSKKQVKARDISFTIDTSADFKKVEKIIHHLKKTNKTINTENLIEVYNHGKSSIIRNVPV